MKSHYENESAMRRNHPWIAAHLATIAQLIDGLYQAQTGGNIYTWEVTQ